MHPGVSNFQTVLTPIGARCDLSYLIKMCTCFCHFLFLPNVCVRLRPALMLPTRDAGDNYLWSEPLRISTYDSSVIKTSVVETHTPSGCGRKQRLPQQHVLAIPLRGRGRSAVYLLDSLKKDETLSRTKVRCPSPLFKRLVVSVTPLLPIRAFNHRR